MPGVKLLVRRYLNETHVGIFPSSLDVAMGLTRRRSTVGHGPTREAAQKSHPPSQLELRAYASRLVVHLRCCCCTAAETSVSNQLSRKQGLAPAPVAARESKMGLLLCGACGTTGPRRVRTPLRYQVMDWCRGRPNHWYHWFGPTALFMGAHLGVNRSMV